jgi:signal transduction histidine kinase
VIRDEADELGLAPAPGLADLPALVERFRDSGLHVDLDVAESLPTLPAGVDVSAYRIVQEALTNALRYGADRRAALQLTGTASSLSIRASNRTGTQPPGGSGLGLLGMAERVSVLGGQFSHGVTGDGRFELAATLPVEPR